MEKKDKEKFDIVSKELEDLISDIDRYVQSEEPGHTDFNKELLIDELAKIGNRVEIMNKAQVTTEIRRKWRAEMEMDEILHDIKKLREMKILKY